LFTLRAVPLLAAPFGCRGIARRGLDADHSRQNALREVSEIRQSTLCDGGAASRKGCRQHQGKTAR
jgi:hypothetical protein